MARTKPQTVVINQEKFIEGILARAKSLCADLACCTALIRKQLVPDMVKNLESLVKENTCEDKTNVPARVLNHGVKEVKQDKKVKPLLAKNDKDDDEDFDEKADEDIEPKKKDKKRKRTASREVKKKDGESKKKKSVFDIKGSRNYDESVSFIKKTIVMHYSKNKVPSLKNGKKISPDPVIFQLSVEHQKTFDPIKTCDAVDEKKKQKDYTPAERAFRTEQLFVKHYVEEEELSSLCVDLKSLKTHFESDTKRLSEMITKYMPATILGNLINNWRLLIGHGDRLKSQLSKNVHVDLTTEKTSTGAKRKSKARAEESPATKKRKVDDIPALEPDSDKTRQKEQPNRVDVRKNPSSSLESSSVAEIAKSLGGEYLKSTAFDMISFEEVEVKLYEKEEEKEKKFILKVHAMEINQFFEIDLMKNGSVIFGNTMCMVGLRFHGEQKEEPVEVSTNGADFMRKVFGLTDAIEMESTPVLEGDFVINSLDEKIKALVVKTIEKRGFKSDLKLWISINFATAEIKVQYLGDPDQLVFSATFRFHI